MRRDDAGRASMPRTSIAARRSPSSRVMAVDRGGRVRRRRLSGWSFLPSVAVAVVAASLLALLAHGRRLLLGESVALSAVSFVVLGGIAVGGLPTPGAYRDFVDGLVNGWAEFLLVRRPRPTSRRRSGSCPYTIAWFAAAVGAEIARHSRRPGLPAIGPILGLGLTLLFTIEDRRLAVVQGAGIVAGTLVLVSLAHRLGTTRGRRSPSTTTSTAGRGRRTAGALGARWPRASSGPSSRRRSSGPGCRSPTPTSASTCAATRCPRSTRWRCPARSCR